MEEEGREAGGGEGASCSYRAGKGGVGDEGFTPSLRPRRIMSSGGRGGGSSSSSPSRVGRGEGESDCGGARIARARETERGAGGGKAFSHQCTSAPGLFAFDASRCKLQREGGGGGRARENQCTRSFRIRRLLSRPRPPRATGVRGTDRRERERAAELHLSTYPNPIWRGRGREKGGWGGKRTRTSRVYATLDTHSSRVSLSRETSSLSLENIQSVCL